MIYFLHGDPTLIILFVTNCVSFRFIDYLRRHNYHVEAFQQEQYLNSLDHPDSEDDSSSSDNDMSETGSKVTVGDEINLDQLTGKTYCTSKTAQKLKNWS